uniref:Trichohyalin-plectin-homology domain-containing protein n=1 Tax=Stomoxys calcitrans TaxID=35570 RepID=A0A1I8PYM5_STOCA
MTGNRSAIEMKQLMEHHKFIVNTDRKSLHCQIKTLVQRAQAVASKELEKRRAALKHLLDSEDTAYMEEYANKIKSQSAENIKQRQVTMQKIKDENAKKEHQLLKAKRIQQYMNSCYEIREALRHQEMQNVKECQLEQILEKQHAFRRQQEEDKFWLKVEQKNEEAAMGRLQEEERLKKLLVQHTSAMLKIQVNELEKKKEEQRQQKLEEKQKIRDHLEELRLEEFDSKHGGKSSKVLEYRKELSEMMAQKQIQREKEQAELVEYQRKTVNELSRIETQEAHAILEKKKALHKATIDYIQYVKRMRKLELQQQRMYDERIEDFHRLEICTKTNMQREKERKTSLAEKCYAELQQQICEQRERRLREEAEQRECKILENRFARTEISRKEILDQRRKNREDLDKQITEIRRIRQEEAAKFVCELTKATNDVEFCTQLAKEYLRDGIDYLEPHANWRLISDPMKPCVSYPRPRQVIKHERKEDKKALKPEENLTMSAYANNFCDGRGDEGAKKLNNIVL